MCIMSHQTTPLFVLIPAAGSGQRLGAALPKQYLRLHDRTILEWTVARLHQGLRPVKIAVVLSAQDSYFNHLPKTFTETVLPLYCGGATRAESVRNGLAAMMQQHDVQTNDWVAVHDAARPCVPLSCLQALTLFMDNARKESREGALLAMPLADTLKSIVYDGEQVRVAETVDRRSFWSAQTPQIFRAGVLYEALSATSVDDVTDESQAVENWCRKHHALTPRLLRGSAHNIKITYPEDIALAKTILEQQERKLS